MIKRNIKLFTALLAVALIVSVSIFNACKKENNIPLVNSTNTMEFPAKDYNTYIEDLMVTTGIDIKKLSKLDEIRKIANVQREIIAVAIETSNSKGEFTEEKLEQMQNLLEAIYAASNDDEILTLYDSYCAICTTINFFHINGDGIPLFTFDPNNPFVVTEPAVVLIEKIITNYPQFPSLSEETQIDIIAAAIFLDVQEFLDIDPEKTPNQADCKKAAAQDYAVTASVATATLQAGLMGCAFSGPAAGACCAIAGASYGVAMGVGYWQYKRAVARC
jgi:hypothetical protein